MNTTCSFLVFKVGDVYLLTHRHFRAMFRRSTRTFSWEMATRRPFRRILTPPHQRQPLHLLPLPLRHHLLETQIPLARNPWNSQEEMIRT